MGFVRCQPEAEGAATWPARLSRGPGALAKSNTAAQELNLQVQDFSWPALLDPPISALDTSART